MHVDAVRRFNRFYTRRVGALRAGLLGSPYPLPEARLLYEIGQRRECTASELAARPGSRRSATSAGCCRACKRRGLLQREALGAGRAARACSR